MESGFVKNPWAESSYAFRTDPLSDAVVKNKYGIHLILSCSFVLTFSLNSKPFSSGILMSERIINGVMSVLFKYSSAFFPLVKYSTLLGQLSSLKTILKKSLSSGSSSIIIIGQFLFIGSTVSNLVS